MSNTPSAEGRRGCCRARRALPCANRNDELHFFFQKNAKGSCHCCHKSDSADKTVQLTILHQRGKPLNLSGWILLPSNCFFVCKKKEKWKQLIIIIFIFDRYSILLLKSAAHSFVNLILSHYPHVDACQSMWGLSICFFNLVKTFDHVLNGHLSRKVMEQLQM